MRQSILPPEPELLVLELVEQRRLHNVSGDEVLGERVQRRTFVRCRLLGRVKQVVVPRRRSMSGLREQAHFKAKGESLEAGFVPAKLYHCDT